MGCAGSKLLPLPDDTNARGPWPVGEKTAKIGRLNAVEIMYPAKPGSEQGKDVLKIDLRTFLPMSERSKVSDAEATIVNQQTYADLPIDDERGPYPIAIFVHVRERVGGGKDRAADRSSIPVLGGPSRVRIHGEWKTFREGRHSSGLSRRVGRGV
jgi:hypothetical protein